MNLLLRYLILCLTFRTKQTPKFTDVVSRDYRILPHDMGFRDHVPNYRYLSFIELNVQQWLMQQSTIEGARWIIASQQMTYLKQGRFFDKVTLNSQVLGWDSKYFYFRHEFVVRGKVIAVALTKFVLMAEGEILPTTCIADKAEQHHPAIRSWQTNLNEIKQLDTIK
ncbi:MULTISPECIES: acyl-CoA thioesterase [unclassified Moraxella]|uniref:acyl-CoA thioesterase n=1 Tax=unclassified Moraxella TaxID=2685852 RepID=UPI003AF667DA